MSEEKERPSDIMVALVVLRELEKRGMLKAEGDKDA